MAIPTKHHHKITNEHLHEHLLKMEEQVLKLGKDNLFTKKQLKKIMADQQAALDKANELSAKVDEMQATIDQEQADIKNLVDNNAQVVSDLTAQRDALQKIIDEGGAAADFQPLIDSMDSTIGKINAATADVYSTV